ncbi:MAG: hypothetical protein ABIB47_02270 [Candidatus Woesearchaeota archaeon]
MYRFIMNGRRYVVLLKSMDSMRKKNINQLSKDCDMTPSHLTIVMKQWEKEGLIKKIKSGREYVIKLTEVGKELLDIIRKYDQIAIQQSEKSKIQESEKEVNNGIAKRQYC